MKYYVIDYVLLPTSSHANLGDYNQSIAVANFLQQIGISKENIGYTSLLGLGNKNTDREKGILIAATGGLGFYPGGNVIPINDENLRIIYFGTTIPEDMWYALRYHDQFIESLKNHEPIGCRDAATRDFLRSLGIKAYFSKCVTLLFDSRTTPVEKNAYLIDCCYNVNEFLPEKLKPNLKYLSQSIKLKQPKGSETPLEIDDLCKRNAIWANQIAAERLNLLKDTASLVITSRIHAAMPSVAMGIPTIFFYKQKENARVSTVKTVLPIHTSDDFDKIAWDEIKPPDMTSIKYEMSLLLTLRLQIEERKMGVNSHRLSEAEETLAKELLDMACKDESFSDSYRLKSYTKYDILNSIFEGRFDEIVKSNKTISLFGAGGCGYLLSTLLNDFRIPVSCICDNKVKNSNDHFMLNNLDVISYPEFSRTHKNDFIIITARSNHFYEIREQLISSGFLTSQIINPEHFFYVYPTFWPPSMFGPLGLKLDELYSH